MKRFALYLLALFVGAVFFGAFFLAIAAALWVLGHFVAWTPFSGIPWGWFRLWIAIGLVMAVCFAIKEGSK